MRYCETIHRLSRRLRACDYARRAIERIACALAERSRDWPGHLCNCIYIIAVQYVMLNDAG